MRMYSDLDSMLEGFRQRAQLCKRMSVIEQNLSYKRFRADAVFGTNVIRQHYELAVKYRNEWLFLEDVIERLTNKEE